MQLRQIYKSQKDMNLRHVENRQIKKELEKLIQDYKLDGIYRRHNENFLKTKNQSSSTPRRLAFTERQEVNKQIEEWLNEGIIRPSSSNMQVQSLMSENRKIYNRRRKEKLRYKESRFSEDSKRTHRAGLKLRPKFLGPYKVTKVNSKDRYEVEKVGQHEGPNSTATSADLMKHFYA
ncbi:uncharacterized protein TNCV_2012431 [Trichonephila clavipes]|nr:uncharacterized protein TNCV_2012431 [Trichonephila clavipes]